MSLHNKEKKHLSMNGLLNKVRSHFQTISIPKSGNQGPKLQFTLTDCLMSGLALFGLKSPSLLQFQNDSRDDEVIRHNLKMLYQVNATPSDTYLRNRLDKVNPRDLRGAFTECFSVLQRGKYLEDYKFLDEFYLLSIDGTGYFSSKEIHCDQCCIKEHKNGTKTYYHQMLSGAIVHPDRKTVIPICPEPILKQDGATKNDCERNATVRLLKDFRQEHPHLKVIILEDALGSNGPNLKLIKSLNMSFIIGVKPDGNKSLFEWINLLPKDEVTEFEIQKEDEIHRFRYVNRVPLNDTHYDLEVNFLEYWQLDTDRKVVQHFSWVTDITLTKQNIYQIMRGARSRWKIENETFNTLKNQGYNFEHNFGHGYNSLSVVMAFLMMIAFTIDQAVQMGCGLFQAALKKVERRSYLWRNMRALFRGYFIDSWSDLYTSIAYGHKAIKLTPDTS
jgi:hypothetical protein